MAIQNKIRSIREIHQLTQEDMAEKMNISASSYAKIERGDTKLQFDKLQQIANIFHMDVAELITQGEKGIVCLINEQGDFSANYYNAHPTDELEKLQLTIAHKNEIIEYKDKLLVQKDKEIEHLHNIINLMKNN